MDKIPTAEEFAREHFKGILTYKEMSPKLIEFAKLHVKAALEEAGRIQYKIYTNSNNVKELQGYRSMWENADIAKTLILNAYPDKLII